jgi:hypothetical protein
MDFEPLWVRQIRDPSVKMVLIIGCGGGFDFTHSLLIIPTILEFGKKFIIVSNSFTNPSSLREFEVVYKDKTNPKAVAHHIVPSKITHKEPLPEGYFVNFLEEKLGKDHGNYLYATNACEMDDVSNNEFFQILCEKHSIDGIITADGGSDSLMRGDECDIASVYEDYLSMISANDIMKERKDKIKFATLLVFGFGTDRFHGATDASSMRAVAELTRMGGFLGSCSIMPGSKGFELFSDFYQYMAQRMTKRSIVSAMILASAVGQFGPTIGCDPAKVPRDMTKIPKSAAEMLQIHENGDNPTSCGNQRVDDDSIYIWPPMSTIFGFNIQTVLERTVLASSTRRNAKVKFEIAYENRTKMGVENFPRSED